MAIRIETSDPGTAGVRDALEGYRRSFPDCADALELYASIMEVQQKALGGIECALDFSDTDIEKRLREGTPLLDPAELDLSLRDLRGVISGICAAVERGDASRSSGCEELLEWDGLGDEGFTETRKKVLEGEDLGLKEEWKDITVVALASGMIWEGMVPFYRRCARELQDKIDHSLWLRGYCPICGTGPLMGKFRCGDGLWLLECRLCHTMWNVRRATCPFCSQGKEGSLEYLFLEGRGSYRAYYCSQCRRYVKTIDLRPSQKDALLPLENIVSEMMGLDRAAEQEGLVRA